MSHFPHTKLLLSPSRAVLISGPHIQSFHPITGALLHSTSHFAPPARDALLKSGPVRCAALTPDGASLATAGDDKMLKVWSLEDLSLVSQRELPKKPTSIQFTADAQTILVSDKFGDVFSYPFHPSPAPTLSEEKPKTPALASHENPSGGQLVLGHASLLTTFALTHGERYIVTADRDEHIRVSWFPKGYVIERYCLGHKKFVSALHLPASHPTVLLSGGGDPSIKLWDWMEGKVVREIEVREAIEPSIVVKAVAGRRNRDDGDDGDGDGGAGGEARRGKRKRGKEKGKEKEIDDSKASEEPEDAVTPPPNSTTASTTTATSTVLVLHKIDTLSTDDGVRVLFSAVGATALFSCPFPDLDGTAESEPEKIQTYDFGKPILDFIVECGDHGKGKLVWALVDAEWSGGGDSKPVGADEYPAALVRIVRWSGLKFDELDGASGLPLLTAVNSAPSLLPATPADIVALDLYGALNALPKNTTPQTHAGADAQEEGVTKRMLGRMKNKKAIEELARVGEHGEEEERESKRTRGSVGPEQDDVLMAES